MSEESPNIYQRLLAISTDAEVSKDGTAPNAVGGYAFHKIDDVEAALKPLWTKHGVKAIPTTAEMDIQQSSGWNIATARVDVAFVNVDKPDDLVVVTAHGQGFDKMDKATNKAISYATKALYLSLFHLKGQPDNEDEATDSHVPVQGKQSNGTRETPTEKFDYDQHVKRENEEGPDLSVYVGFGKNENKKWSELSVRSLQWYAEKARAEQTRGYAKAELDRRKTDLEDIIPPADEPPQEPSDDGELPF
jgi:hypothetical protein